MIISNRLFARFVAAVFLGAVCARYAVAAEPIRFSGSFSGNMKTGTVAIGKTVLDIEGLGNLAVEGGLMKWGKDGMSLFVNVRQVSLRRLSELFSLNLPVRGGAADGAVTIITDSAKKTQKIIFDLTFADLAVAENGSVFHGSLAGFQDGAAGRMEITKGIFENEKGGKITFSGSIIKDEFNIKASGDGLTVQDIVPFLPQDLREKINVGVDPVPVSLNDVEAEGGKKKSDSPAPSR